MKNTFRLWGLSLLLIVLWLYNSYKAGDFDQPTQQEAMEQMEARFPALPEMEYSDKKDQLEFDLEEYEKTVDSIHTTIRDRLEIQSHILDDSQVALRPAYEEPRSTHAENHEVINPPPVPKMIHSMG